MITTIALTKETKPEDLRELSKFVCDYCGGDIPNPGISLYAEKKYGKLPCLKCIGKLLRKKK
jgi:hypothetical protein